MFTVGDKVGAYEIVAEMKSGGMAQLFLGWRRGAAGFAKLVALKVVHEHLVEDPQFVQMFLDEAMLSAKIAHPNVVHVEELGEAQGQHFMVMEFVFGCSLNRLLSELAQRGRRLAVELCVHIAIKVADGLHAAHETRDSSGNSLGVVHRDISPQNILLAYQGNVKLIDFGVAKAKGRAQQTQAGHVKGKFHYMSPEQTQAGGIDRRSDVYALGVVLWEMLTMRRRHSEESDIDVIRAVRSPKRVAPSKMMPNISPELDAVVLRALALKPSDRYQTARDFRDGLVRAVPKAIALHESELADLLAGVMAKEIEKARDALPSNVSGVSAKLPLPQHESVEEAFYALTSNVEIDLPDWDATAPAKNNVHEEEDGFDVETARLEPEPSTTPDGKVSLNSTTVPVGEVSDPATIANLAAKTNVVRSLALVVGGMLIVVVVAAISFTVSRMLQESPNQATNETTTEIAGTPPEVASIPSDVLEDPSGRSVEVDVEEAVEEEVETEPGTHAEEPALAGDDGSENEPDSEEATEEESATEAAAEDETPAETVTQRRRRLRRERLRRRHRENRGSGRNARPVASEW